MPAGGASGDIAQNYLLEPLSQAAATKLYLKDTIVGAQLVHFGAGRRMCRQRNAHFPSRGETR